MSGQDDAVVPEFKPPQRTSSAPSATATAFAPRSEAFNFRGLNRSPARGGPTPPPNTAEEKPKRTSTSDDDDEEDDDAADRGTAGTQGTTPVYEVNMLLNLKRAIYLDDYLSAAVQDFATTIWPKDAQRPGAVPQLSRTMFRDEPAVRTRERTLTHQVRGILGKLTPENYPKLKEELVALPIRQSEEHEITEVVKTMYQKAVQPEDELYVELYAKLMADLVQHYVEQKSKVGQMIRKAIIDRCQVQFEQPFRLSDDELKNEDGEDLTEEEIQFKRQRLKDKLRSNIKFLGHLFVSHMITEKVVNFVLFELLYGKNQEQQQSHKKKRKPEEYELEMFCDLLRKVVGQLSPKILEEYIPGYMSSIQNLTQSGSLSNRIRFMLQDMLDLQRNGWVDKRKKATGPMTLKDLERTKEEERVRALADVDKQIAMNQQMQHGNRRGHHDRSGGSPRVPLQPTAIAKKEAVPLPPLSSVLTWVDSYKVNREHGDVARFFTPIPREHRIEFLQHWMARILKAAKRDDERQMVGEVIKELTTERLADLAEIHRMIASSLCSIVVEEYGDLPKVFSCWASLVSSASASTSLGADLHTELLNKLIAKHAAMSDMVKMISDVLETQAPRPQQVDTREVPKRFRLLPAVLSYQPPMPGGRGEDGEGDNGGEAGNDDNNDDGDDDFDEEDEQHDDLFGALLDCDRSAAQDIEIRTLDMLISNNAGKLLDFYRRDPQRGDSVFVMKMVCAIFTYVRCDESDNKRELERCKEVLQALAKPAKDNEFLVLVEAYLTWREFGRLPAQGFARFYDFCVKTLKFDPESYRQFKNWLAKHFRRDGDAELLDKIAK